jgi:hypothetical protein
MVTTPNIRGQSLDVQRRMRLHLAIPQIREAILVPIADIVIFEAWVLDGFEEMNRLHHIMSALSH